MVKCHKWFPKDRTSTPQNKNYGKKSLQIFLTIDVLYIVVKLLSFSSNKNKTEE